MTWLLPILPVVGLLIALLAILIRRRELARSADGLAARQDAIHTGSHAARLLHPAIDLGHCIGCGSCVTACPEDGVLAMVHGQAAVVHGARCVGHGNCADACPVGAIALTLGDLSSRRDLPALTEDLQVIGVPGLFIAGELSGFALVRTAITQGVAVANAVALRVPAMSAPTARRGGVGIAVLAPEGDSSTTDLLIVGSGPAGLACALRAKELGLRAQVIEQEPHIGGAVAAYPRKKLVMTQPVFLPLHGRLAKLSYQKEELVELWEQIAERESLAVHTATRLVELARDGDEFVARTSRGELRARNVCLALGRRGTPRKLGVPGEDYAKVHYALIDAQSWSHSRVLVVGGGDSAVEAALGLAAQPGNEVTLSYRKNAFFRLKSRNDAAIRAAMATGSVRVCLGTQPTEIHSDQVELCAVDDAARRTTLDNDAVFVFAGGVPPFGLLEAVGVSFDPGDRPAAQRPELDRGRGLLVGLATALVLALVVVGFRIAHDDYYSLSLGARAQTQEHDDLQPSGAVGLTAGLLGVTLFACNLSYLLRRSRRFGRRLPGSLRTWMSAHVVTGLAAFFCVLLHAGMAPRDTVGGHALWVLGVVVITGSIGRWIYAFVPRATNGKELEFSQLQTRIAAISSEWDRDGRGFGAEVRNRIEQLVHGDRERWRRGFLARIATILRSRRDLERCLADLRRAGVAEGVPLIEVRALLGLARRAHRMLVAYAHFEEVRAVLGSWRYLHRWLAVLMVLLTAVHVVTALRFGSIDWAHLPLLGGSR